jgi:predicted nucleotidyltransferase
VRLDPAETIRGVPILVVRDAVRRAQGGFVNADFFSQCLKTSRRKTLAVVDELTSRGYLELTDRASDDGPWYSVTINGSTFALASGAKPVSRATATRHLNALLERVTDINESGKYCYTVTTVLVFGSYLKEVPRLSDIDIAVELTRRFPDGEAQRAFEQQSIAQAERSGKRFANIVERLFWPQHQVLLHLKARSRVISLHTTDDAILKVATSRQVFPVTPDVV